MNPLHFKSVLVTIILTLSVLTTQAQTAVDFTANDCAGNSHNLFSELNSGKVIVIAWVMPCDGCTLATQIAYGVVQNYAISNPGQVLMYVVDDYGDGDCFTMNHWVNDNNVPNVTAFCDSTIRMTDYGGVGMPKIIVLGGGYNHGLYFNENNTAAEDSAGIQAAVDSALAGVTAVHNIAVSSPVVSVFPNPATNNVVITLSPSSSQNVLIDVYNELGQKVMLVFSGELSPGEHQIQFSVEGLAQGNYWMRITEGEKSHDERLTITR